METSSSTFFGAGSVGFQSQTSVNNCRMMEMLNTRFTYTICPPMDVVARVYRANPAVWDVSGGPCPKPYTCTSKFYVNGNKVIHEHVLVPSRAESIPHVVTVPDAASMHKLVQIFRDSKDWMVKGEFPHVQCTTCVEGEPLSVDFVAGTGEARCIGEEGIPASTRDL